MADDSRERMEETYRRYETEEYSAKWAPSIAGNQAILKERIALATRLAPTALEGDVIIDLGAGSSISFPGVFDDATIVRADILLHRLVQAHESDPDGRFVCTNGAALPFTDRSIKGVVVSTLFSSVQAVDVQQSIGAEVTRVLAAGGFVVWYDIRLPNPSNKMISALHVRDVRRIFPLLHVESSKSCTVLPPLARRLGTMTERVYGALARVPLLRSHLLVVLRKDAP